MAASTRQREMIRDIVLTHAHLDHVAGLPLFIDDLFASLTEPIRIHAAAEVIEVLERDIFNWSVYPKFSELENSNGRVLEYREFRIGEAFRVKHLTVTPVAVNHKVPATGFLISDGKSTVGLTGDTAVADGFRQAVLEEENVSALLVECAFPDELAGLAEASFHLTPSKLRNELDRGERPDCPIYAINLKPMYREQIVEQISRTLPELQIFEVGKIYEF